MKYLSTTLGALLLLVISCNQPVSLVMPTVSYTPVDDGATLRLTWTMVEKATGYTVYVDGVPHSIISGIYSYDVSSPAKLIQVSAVAKSSESDKWSLTTTVKKTSNVAVYSMADSQQINHAFYFDATGTAIAIPMTQASDVDFVLDTTQTAGAIQLRSPNSYDPVYNTKSNSSAATSVTNLNDLTIAPATGADYSPARTISESSVYALWLDPSNDGWSAEDHFAKIKVEALSGTSVTLTTEYQTVPGLRWLISD
ncbi:hypothetical protein JXD38_10645 [candidate division WOR-3 bacterium]|nr:hypothetical protein [candidate division WOR-3 bacterium]